MPKATDQTIRKSDPSPDPIFEAMERHKKLDEIFFDRCRDKDKDEGRASQCDVDRANDAAEIAGTVAMLRYITDADYAGLFDTGEAKLAPGRLPHRDRRAGKDGRVERINGYAGGFCLSGAIRLYM
jgi:hypothetical protein